MNLTDQQTESLDGTPVWHLRRVSLENMPAVLRTNAWIHYSDLGDEGWGLVAHGVQAEAWQGSLARLGIEIAPWPELPIRPWVYNYAILIPFGIIVGVPLLATFVGAFIGAGILGWVMHRHSRKIRHIRIAPGLRKVLEYTSIKDNYAYAPVREGGEQCCGGIC